MNRIRLSLAAAALALSIAGAVLGARSRAPADPPQDIAVSMLDAFAVAKVLAESPPDTVVVTLDSPKHPLRGAVPASIFGADDEAFLRSAPTARGVVLAGADPVRVDRLARRLIASGRRVSVLAGGTDAWDRVMDEDPPAPPAGASSEVWAQHRTHVALRRSFGDAAAAAAVAAPVLVPVLPAQGGAVGAPKKREGC